MLHWQTRRRRVLIFLSGWEGHKRWGWTLPLPRPGTAADACRTGRNKPRLPAADRPPSSPASHAANYNKYTQTQRKHKNTLSPFIYI